MTLFVLSKHIAETHTRDVNNFLELTHNARPIPIRLRGLGGQVKEYVLIVTKQGGLVLNKRIDGSSQN